MRDALRYAERGWAVHPLRPRRKDPATPNGCRDATRDLGRIRTYWTRRPEANIGIATGRASGLWILDVDGSEGLASLASLVRDRPRVLLTECEVRTARGFQLYFRFPELVDGFDLRNSAGKLGKGLDVRGEGGYVVAPPSIHPTGAVYRWFEGHGAPLHAPAWLLSRVVAPLASPPPPPAAPSCDDEARLSALHRACLESAPGRIANAAPGTRNQALNAEAYGLARARVPRAHAEYALKNAAIAAGLQPREIAKTFESGWRAGCRAAPLPARGAR